MSEELEVKDEAVEEVDVEEVTEESEDGKKKSKKKIKIDKDKLKVDKEKLDASKAAMGKMNSKFKAFCVKKPKLTITIVQGLNLVMLVTLVLGGKPLRLIAGLSTIAAIYMCFFLKDELPGADPIKKSKKKGKAKVEVEVEVEAEAEAEEE